MSTVSNTIFNMSITGSVVILVIIFVRFVLQNAPKKYSYILWSVAGFRLCCPFSFQSVVSLFNINPVQKPNDIVADRGTMNYIDVPVNTPAPQTNVATIHEADASATMIAQHQFTDFIPYIWLSGLIILVIIGSVNFVKTRKMLSTATKKCGNIYRSESISAPFILGIIKPKIYIPYNIDEAYMDYVIAHERYHLKRGDNIIKLFAFVLLCVHWFNPFCWIAFYLVNKDMEMSCDEWVLSHNDGIKKTYSNALLSFATEKNFPTPTPLCFVEGSAKSRIKHILKYKKPAVIVSIIAIILCAAVTVVCIANPTDDTRPADYYIDACYQRIEEKVEKANANPSQYKTIAAEEFKELENDYKQDSLSYVYKKFLQGNQTGIKANAMLIVMKDLIGEEQIETASDDPQAYFDEFLLYNVNLLNQNSQVYMERHYPKGYKLIHCLDSRINEICDIIREYSSSEFAFTSAFNTERIADKTNSEFVGDVTSGVYSAAYKCGNTLSFVIIDQGNLITYFSIGGNEYAFRENAYTYRDILRSSETNDNEVADSGSYFDFIYDDYWYYVVYNDDNTEVVYHKYNKDNHTVEETIYTLDKSGKWSTKNEKYLFAFGKFYRINILYSDNRDSGTWWYVNVMDQTIEKRDKLSGEVLYTLTQTQEKSVSGARTAITRHQKPYQHIKAFACATSSWKNGKITVDLDGHDNVPSYMQLRWAIEEGVSIKSADLAIAIDGKEVFTEPMSIVDIRDDHVWDYLACTKKDKYIVDCKNKESVCEVYAKCFDDRGAEYHVYLTRTEFNTETDAIAYTYILYNGYGFWY